MRYVLGMLAALCVSGCNSLNQLNGPAPLLDDSFIGANSALGPLAVTAPTTAVPNAGSLAAATLIEQFYASAREAKIDPTSAKLLTAFNDGAAIMNARCQVFFRGLGIDARNLSYAQSQLTVITGGLTTVLALVSASQAAVAAVAAGSTALLTGMKQFGDAYYFSADVSAVEQLVTKAQREAMDKINQAGNGPANFAAVITMLVSYQMICQPHTIKHLVTAAVAAGNPIPEFQSPTVSQRIDTVLVGLGSALGTSASTPLEFAVVEVLFENSTNTNSLAFRVACGYAYSNGLVPADMIVPAAIQLDKDGNCPQGTGLSNTQAMIDMRTEFMRRFRNSFSVGRDYWNPYLQQVRSATAASAIQATTPSPAPAAPVPAAPRAATATPMGGEIVNRGRVGGFSITVK